MQSLECRPGRKFYLCAIRECEDNIVAIRSINTLEERVAVLTIFSVGAICSVSSVRTILAVLAVLTRCLAKLRPARAVIVRNHPIAVFDLKLRSNAVLTVSSRYSLGAVRAIRAIRAVETYSLDFISTSIRQPLAVKGPIVDTVRILLYANLRSVTILSVSSVCSVLAILTVLAVVDRYGIRLREVDSITDCLTILHHRRNRSDVVVILQRRHDCLKCRDVSIHLVAQGLQLLKSIPSRHFHLSTIRKGENHIILIRIVHIGKHRVANKTCIALVTFVALIALISLISLLAGGFTELIPGFAIVVRYVPIVILDLELRGDSILAVLAILAVLTISTIRSVSSVCSVLAIFSILTIGARSSVCAISTVLTVGTLSFNLVAIIVEQPLAIKSPIVDAVRVLLYANMRSVTVLTICAILAVFAINTVLTILTVVDGDSCRLSEGNGITNGHTTLGDGRNTRNVIVLLQSINDTLQRRDVGIHLATHLLELFNSILQILDISADLSVIIRLSTAYNQTDQNDRKN